ncbi:MAG: acetoacetate decarboxylase family protein [Actinomycetota bacterium]
MPAIPRVSPLYPDPPYLYEGSRMAVAMYRIPPESAQALLPQGMQFGGLEACLAIFADYQTSTVGAYHEVVFLVSAEYEGVHGFFCPFIYVTTDATLASGREIWGFPKKIAKISVDKKGDSVSASITRAGASIELRASVTNSADPAMVSALTAMPTFNEKIIPSADGLGVDVSAITSTSMTLTPSVALAGPGTIKISGGPQDAWDLLIPEGDVNDVAAFWVEADAVLPAATVVGKAVLR